MPKPKLTPKNRAIVEKALRAMLWWPETYDQGKWIEHDLERRATKRRPAPYCGTVACIAGHIALAAGARFAYVDVMRFRGELWGVNLIADEILGEGAARALFDARADWWPGEFRLPFQAAETAKARATIAVARVRHWLRTGK